MSYSMIRKHRSCYVPFSPNYFIVTNPRQQHNNEGRKTDIILIVTIPTLYPVLFTSYRHTKPNWIHCHVGYNTKRTLPKFSNREIIFVQ